MVSEEWLSLRQASDMTGKSVNALRLLVNRKRFDMVKREDRNGHCYWLIHRDSLMKTCGQKVATTSNGQATTSPHDMMTTIPLEYFDGKLKEWEGERDELKSGLMMYRYKYEELERQVRLLPAPVDQVSSKMTEMEEALKAEVEYREKLTSALHEERAARAHTEAELEHEKKRPWWKRLWI